HPADLRGAGAADVGGLEQHRRPSPGPPAGATPAARMPAPPAMYQDRSRALCTSTRPGETGRAAERHSTVRYAVCEVFMIRLKMAAAAAVGTGVLAGGLAMPPAASADTTQIVYAWGDNHYGQAGVDPAIYSDDVL